MGFFKKLYSTALKPVLKPIGRGLGYYEEYVHDPLTFWAKLTLEHPKTLISDEEYARVLREKGIIEPGEKPAGPVALAWRSKKAREAERRDIAKLPIYTRLPLEIAADPLTWVTFGWGSVARAGARGGVRAALGTAAREAIYQTGLPQVAGLAKLPYTIYRSRSLAQMRQMLTAHEAVKSLSNLTESPEELARAEEMLRAAITGEQKLGFIARRQADTAGQVQRAWKALGSVMEKRMDQSLLAADIYNNSRWRYAAATKIGRSIQDVNLINQLVLPYEELNAAIKTDTIRSLGGLQKGISKLPRPLKNIWSALDPSTQQVMLENPTIFKSWIFRNKFIERGEGVDAVIAAHVSRWQQRVGLGTDIARIGDAGAAPVVKKPLLLRKDVPSEIANSIRFDAKGRAVFEDVMRWGPKAFQMTPEQMFFWQASHDLLQSRIRDYKTYLEGIPEFMQQLKRNRELATSFRLMGQPEPDGSLYWPRVVEYMMKPGKTTAEFTPSRMAKVMARIPVVSAYADMPLPAGVVRMGEIRSRLGATQPFEYLRELERPEHAQHFIWSGDAGKVLYSRFREMAVSAADETILPALVKLGKTPGDLISPDLLAHVDQIKQKLDRAGKVKGVLRGIWRARGTSPRVDAELRRQADIVQKMNWPEMEEVLASLGPTVEQHTTLTMALPKELLNKARQLGRFGGTEAAEQALRMSARARVRGAVTQNVVDNLVTMRKEYVERQRVVKEYFDRLPQNVQSIIRNINKRGRKLTEESILKQARKISPEMADAIGPLVGDYMKARANMIEVAKLVRQQIMSVPETAQAAARELLRIGDTQRAEETFRRAVVKAMGARIHSEEAIKVADDYLVSRKALAEAVSNANKQIDDLVRQVRAELKEARAAIREIQKSGQTFHGLYRSKVPALSGRLFPEKLAKEIDKRFLLEAGAGETAVRAAAAVQVPAQTMLTGGDLSYIFLQGLAAISNPAGFARSILLGVRQLFDRDAYLNYLRGLGQAVNPQSGRTILEEAVRANVRLVGSELYHATESLTAMGVQSGRMQTIGEFLNRLPWNVAFSTGRNVAALEMFRAQTALEGAFLRRALTDDELRGIGREVNLATGAVSMKELGIGPGQAAVERAFGRLGVQWFRSQTGRLVQAFNMGQIEGRVARRLLFQQLTAMTSLYVATAELHDQMPQLDPTKPHFLQLRVGNTWVGWGGIYPSMMKAVIRTMQAVNEGDWERLEDIKKGRNPILNFWHGGAPILGRLIADAVLDVNSQTRYGNTMTHPEELIVPISVQSAVEGLGKRISPTQAVLQGVFAGAGLATNPITAVEYFQDVSNRIAQEKGYPDWEHVPKVIQEELRRSEPDLQEAAKERDKYYEAYGQTPEDRAFEQRKQNLDAMETVLVGLWGRVQKGEISKSEWRQTASVLWERHAAITNALFAGLPDKKKADPVLLQDRLAADYESIRPEAFDADGDGVIGEAEWAKWREAKREWWQRYPEAKKYEDYIRYDYPVRVFDDPVMRAAERERREAQTMYDEFLQIPKYHGLSAEDAQVVDSLRGLRTSVRNEIRFRLAERGLPVEKIKIPSQLVWKITLHYAAKQGLLPSPKLAAIAILLDKDEVQKRLRNLGRVRFLLENKGLLDWYPQARTDAGLSDVEAVRFNLLKEPVGTPLEERLTTLQGALSLE